MDLALKSPRPAEPFPIKAEPPYDTTLDHAPFETLKEYYPCPAAGVSRTLMTQDIEGAQSFAGIKDPLDPMCLNKPYPDIWLVGPVNKNMKPSRTLQTNRHISPLDPVYQLPSGPCLIPQGEKIFSKRMFNFMLDNNDIPGAKAESYYKLPCRCILPGADVPEPWRGSKPKKWTWMRNRMFYGQGLELHDINIGKKQYGFRRARESDPLEPLYPTEPMETPEMKYRRLKFRRLPPRQKKTNPCERLLDNVSNKTLTKPLFQIFGDPLVENMMYWRAEQLPNVCRYYGQPQPKDNAVSYDAFRYTLETFGLFYTDDEFNRLLPFADPDKTGSFRYLNFSKQLRHNDGFEIDIPKPVGFDMGYWGSPSCLGQGCNVLEHVPKYGKKCNTWEEHQQIYNPLTGNPVPVWTHKIKQPHLDHGRRRSCWPYNYLEILGKLQEEEHKKGTTQYAYFPSLTGPAPPHKKLAVAPPTMPIRKVSLSSAELNHRPSACQNMDSLADKDLANHTCEKPINKQFNLAAVETAKGMGAMVRKTTASEIRNRQDSRLPPLHSPLIPTNSLRGSVVNWVPPIEKPQTMFNKIFIPHNIRVAQENRINDIAVVKQLQVID